MSPRTTRSLVGVLVVLVVAILQPMGLEAAAPRSDVRLEIVSTPTVTGRSRRASSTQRLPFRSDMLGATWRGSTTAVELRARVRGGAWSAWVELEADEDGPDPASVEGRTQRRGDRHTASTPVWVGAADEVQVRRHDAPGSLRDVHVVALDASGVSRLGRGRARSTLPEAVAAPASPGIRRRATWGAVDPKADPVIAEDGLKGVVVHHTASTNRYSCAQVPALLRGFQRYHMRVNGWNDIGYNYLVDACGGVWEGRAGGTTKAVLGAHTAGFNTGTTGIALIGSYASARPSTAARRALERLIAWRLDVAHVKPTARMVLTAASSDKFAYGSRVSVRAVSGHRDLFPTSCPGTIAYGQLTAIARTAWARGGIKVANVTRSVRRRAPDDPLDASVASVSIRAVGNVRDMGIAVRLVRSSTGEVLHAAESTGSLARVRWTPPAALAVPDWDIRVEVTGTRGSQRARPAVMPLVTVPADPGLRVTTAPPALVAPGGDPVDDHVTFAYTLAAEYRLGVTLHDPTTGALVATLLTPRYVGVTSEPVAMALRVPDSVPTGTWELRIALPADTARGRSVARSSLTVVR